MMTRVVLVIAAFLSPFLFPYPATIILSFAAGLVLPPVPLLVGAITDALYFTPGVASFPIASVTGLVLSVAAFFMQRFLKARIMAA